MEYRGLRGAECVLLEPWYDFRLEVPTENIGRAMTDITQMNGRFGDPETIPDGMALVRSAPAAKMRGYHRELVGYIKGAGKLFTSLRGYEECANPDSVIAEIGYYADKDGHNVCPPCKVVT